MPDKAGKSFLEACGCGRSSTQQQIPTVWLWRQDEEAQMTPGPTCWRSLLLSKLLPPLHPFLYVPRYNVSQEPQAQAAVPSSAACKHILPFP